MSETIQLRTFHDDDDYAYMATIIAASEQADDQPRSISAADLKKLIGSTPGLDLHCDLVIAAVGGQPVAYGRVRRPGNDPGEAYSLNCLLAPGGRGMGVEALLLDWLERRAAAITAAQPSGGTVLLHLNPSHKQGWMHALALQAGYHVKESWVLMVRPSLEDLPEAELPPGLEVRTVQPEQYPAIWRAVAEAYAGEGEPAPNEEVPGGIQNEPNFQPGLWQVAWEVSSGKVAGSVMTYINHVENELLGIRRGYTEGISTVPAWRRKGVATALIARSLQAQRDAGMTESALVCNSEKPGNLSLYSQCGFQEVKRDSVYEKAIQPG